MAVKLFTQKQVDDFLFNPSTLQSSVVGFLDAEDLERVHQAYNKMHNLALNKQFAEIRQKRLNLHVVTTSYVNKAGSGGQGTVFEVNVQHYLPPFACKIPHPLKTTAEKSFENVIDNNALLSAIPVHPHINTYRGIVYDRALQRFGALFDFIEGNNLDFHSKYGMPISERIPQTKNLMLQLARALSTLSKAGIAHYDLGEHNIMITREGVLKVVDFDCINYSENALFMRLNFGLIGLYLLMPDIKWEDISQATARKSLESEGIPPWLIELLLNSYDPNLPLNQYSWETIIQTLEADCWKEVALELENWKWED